MMPEDGPRIRAYATLESGVHAIPIDQATELILSSREDETADSTRERDPADQFTVWLDVANPGNAEAAFLRDELLLHPLAVEDCVRGRQRPKLDRYPGYFFLVFYATAVNPERSRMALREVHIFMGERFLITVHDGRVSEIGETIARWRSVPEQFPEVGMLAHALIDTLVDDYFPVLEHIAEELELMEQRLINEEGLEPTRVFRLRHELLLFRRIVSPEREVLSTILRRDLPFLRPDLLLYFQDVHDHLLRVIEEIDSQRELLAGVLDAHRAEAAKELNLTVRMLTAWSIILMSITLIAGIYGMNFARMPELGWRWGYAFALGMMVLVGAAVAAYFRRRGWL